MKLPQTIKYKLTCKWRHFLHKQFLVKGRKEIISYYSAHPTDNEEIKQALDYLREHPLSTFPAAFAQKYLPGLVEVHKEPSNGLLYVMHEGKKLFFKRSFNLATVQHCYHALQKEQDKESPHCYTDNDFEVKQDDVLFDIGSAEGIFPLSNIEKVSQIVLFEKDDEWLEALEATFAPYKEKVTILAKFVSNKDDENNISIDRFLKTYPHQPNFIKIDVEGEECAVLDGMKKHLEANPGRIAICTYHQANDYDNISRRLSTYRFRATPTQGVMVFLNDVPLRPPYFRKGLIKAEKIIQS